MTVSVWNLGPGVEGLHCLAHPMETNGCSPGRTQVWRVRGSATGT
jgi:hypothetical protein